MDRICVPDIAHTIRSMSAVTTAVFDISSFAFSVWFLVMAIKIGIVPKGSVTTKSAITDLSKSIPKELKNLS